FAEDHRPGLRQARRVVRRHDQRRRRRPASLAVRALDPLHRALQGYGGDRARLSAPRLFAAEGDLHHRARRGRMAAGTGGAQPLRRVGSLEEDRRHALTAIGQRTFISTVTRPGCCSVTVTVPGTVPRRSCHTESLYWPGGRLSNAKLPSGPV